MFRRRVSSNVFSFSENGKKIWKPSNFLFARQPEKVFTPLEYEIKDALCVS